MGTKNARQNREEEGSEHSVRQVTTLAQSICDTNMKYCMSFILLSEAIKNLKMHVSDMK